MRRRIMTDEERRYVAFHELGHAAMNYWHRESLHARRIVLHADRFGGSNYVPCADMSEFDLMTLIGGPMAELLSIGSVPKKAIRFPNEYRDTNSDSTRMRVLVRKLCAGKDDRRYQFQVQERVRGIIQHADMWRAITAVAEHLIKNGEISGEELEEIFEQIGVPDQFGKRLTREEAAAKMAELKAKKAAAKMARAPKGKG